MKPELTFPINYSCHFSQFREGEQFTGVHSLGIVLAGNMELDDGQRKITFSQGDIFSARRNHLLKFRKQPGSKGAFRSLSLYLQEDTLRSFSEEYELKAGNARERTAFASFGREPLLVNFMQSLLAYEHLFGDKNAAPLFRLKQQEAILLLLRFDPSLKDILFDFSEPGKIDLEAFMLKNFHFNVQLERFAYLTGRSLSTFKRDFEKIFSETPGRWLLRRRLQEAHYLITQKGMSASDIYLDLGFEDLSHFSYTFKRQFGIAPSRIAAPGV